MSNNANQQISNDELTALKQELAVLKGIQFAMPDPYYVRDWDYNIIVWPDAIAKFTGYSAAEAKRLKCHQMFKSRACPPYADCPTQHCVQTRNFFHDAPVNIYKKNGTVVSALVSNSGVYDEDGTPIAAVEIFKPNKVKEIQNFVETRTGDLNAKTNELFKEGAQKVVSSMKHSYDDIAVLREKSKSILDVVSIIKEISTSTKLVALNALIEAARAGEAGKAFNVVAAEVKRLSENSDKSAVNIIGTTNEIIHNIASVTTALESATRDFSSGLDDLAKMLEGQILQFANDLHVQFESMKNADV